MTQLTPAYRIAAAENAIARHLFEVDPDANRVACTAEDAAELLASLSAWAYVNGFTLRVPRPVYADESGVSQ